MATSSEQLEALRNLGENWDGYGAAAPQVSVINLAQEFVRLIEAVLKKAKTAPGALHVNPTRIGGVLIDWEDLSMQHEVELNPDCSIGFLHYNKATGHIDARKFSPNPQAVVDPAFLQELSQLLAA